jgi:asparagine synthase (glutamine-hydrolysing)
MFYEDRTLDQAVALGTNLIFSGWGGDEFISTGDRGVEQDLLRGMRLRTFFRRNPLKPFGKFILNQLSYVIYPALGILERGTADSFRDDTRFLREQFRKSDRKAIATFFFHRSRRQVHLNMLSFGHLQKRCEAWMINGFRKGVEYRYPLLDRRIIEYMLKVPSHLLCVADTFRPILRELGKGILPDEIRMNYSKTDPVSWAYTRMLYRETALLLLGEAEEWKKNPDLYFIDFDQLGRAIEGIEFSSDRKDDVSFFRSIVTIKYLHEFTRSFRNN